MSTSFPTFCLKISDPLWFTSSEQKDDEMEVCWLESMYQSWVSDFKVVLKHSLAISVFECFMLLQGCENCGPTKSYLKSMNIKVLRLS